MFHKAGLFGNDRSKVNKPEMCVQVHLCLRIIIFPSSPEALGCVVAAVYLVAVFAFVPFYFNDFLFVEQCNMFPYAKVK